ncbi:MAG: hypothetical protein LASZOEIN_001764 [Candidatus Fervidibacter sp.]|jgi:hypothetical protein|nr:hypothetical protein [Armatimonadota bacterium]
MAKTKQLTNNGVSNVALRDTISALKNEVIFPLVALADLLIEVDPIVGDRIDPQPTLKSIGHLLNALVTKAEVILREYLNEPAKD